jgi:hypothetical protein
MNATAKFVWPAIEPLTPRGVAAYAHASFGRLLTTQLIVALICAAAVVWFSKTKWCPVVREAIGRLPEGNEVRYQRLTWKGASPVLLAENRFLALVVDVEETRAIGSVADVRIQFQKDEVQICSLLGCLVSAYPHGWLVAFDRMTLEPWWGAREFAILAATALAVVLALMMSWAALATVYFAVVYFIAYLLDRELTWGGSWRLAGAALMPGALFLTLGIVIYGLQGIGLVRLTIVFALHFVIGWIYVLLTPFFVTRTTTVPLGKNPFAASGEEQTEQARNPFRDQA